MASSLKPFKPLPARVVVAPGVFSLNGDDGGGDVGGGGEGGGGEGGAPGGEGGAGQVPGPQLES